jgi:transposase InsO family protein
MPWKETDPMRERARFVKDARSGVWTMTELCERYGISRKTGYKRLGRFQAEGSEGLEDRSRAPHHCPHRTPDAAIEALLEAKALHPSWGARKLLRWIATRRPGLELPARSTASDWLERLGLVRHRRSRRRWRHPGAVPLHSPAPNTLWTADFKGQFRTRDGTLCYPLTIADQHSRYLLRCEALGSVRTEQAKPVFERLFREVGLPEAIRTDNGAPFCSTAIHGLCAMNVWWIRLGIVHQRIEPSHPEQNGAHERMHRTLKQETTLPSAATLRGQQRLFQRFLHQYNHERPHESLQDQTPAQLWRPSPRPYPRRLRTPEYPAHFHKRLVSNAGTFRFRAQPIFVSQALRQDYVGLEETSDGIWSIYFHEVLLGRLNERTFKVHA